MRSDMELIQPDWPAPANVQAFCTTCNGGNSATPYQSLNLGFHVNDDPKVVTANWQAVQQAGSLPQIPELVSQVHGNRVIELSHQSHLPQPEADGVFSCQPGVPCAILTADCLPVLFTDRAGRQVAAAHAGWRGLADNIIGNTVATFPDASNLMAWLGPAICPHCFEVGPEVRDAFIVAAANWGEGVPSEVVEDCFAASSGDRLLADIYQLARLCLNACGVTDIYGGDHCTFKPHGAQQAQFFSYRRDGVTGRMASVIWLGL